MEGGKVIERKEKVRGKREGRWERERRKRGKIERGARGERDR